MYPTFTEQVCKAQKGPTYVGLYNGQSDLSIRLNSDTAKTAQSNPSGVLGKERKFSERKFIKFWPPDDEHIVLETCRGV